MATNVNNIIGLPLFTGLTRNELNEIADNISFSLSHAKKGSIIAEAESPCSYLSFILQGWFDVDTLSDDKSYSMTETLQGIHTVEPDKLFGLQQRYRSTYTASVPCEVISIDKESVSHLISRYLIVRFNYLNMVCRKSQQMEHHLWRATNDDLTVRITDFIKRHVLYPAGKKVLHITMAQLAKELNDSRLNVSVALNKLANEERIILKRRIIEIPALQLL